MVYGAEKITADWVESKLRSKADCIDLHIEASYKWEAPEEIRAVCDRQLLALEEQEFPRDDNSGEDMLSIREAGLNELLKCCDVASQMQSCVEKEFPALASLDTCLVLVQNDEQAMDLVRSSIARLKTSKLLPILVISDNGSKRELSIEGLASDSQINISIQEANLRGMDELAKPMACGLLRNGRAMFWGAGAAPHMIMHMLRLAN